jgi:hypothetical protein
VTREADYTAVIEALVIAALHALEAHVRDVKKRVAIVQERGAAVAESRRDRGLSENPSGDSSASLS